MGGKGSGGKNRKPTAIKKAEGNRGKRTLNESEPAALPGEPPIPKELSKAARAVWPSICAVLAENQVLYKTHGVAVAALCSSYVQFFLADAAVQKYGIVNVELEELTGVATIKMNPAVRARSDALRHLRSCWQAFGLDPSSMAGLNANPEADKKSKSAINAILRAKSDRDDVVN